MLKERVRFLAGDDWRLRFLLMIFLYESNPKKSRIKVIDGVVYDHNKVLIQLNKEI